MRSLVFLFSGGVKAHELSPIRTERHFRGYFRIAGHTPATALFLLDLNLGKGSFEPEKLLYIPSAVVSWWNGDTHLPFCFCQTEAAITFPACFLPLQVASWVAV